MFNQAKTVLFAKRSLFATLLFLGSSFFGAIFAAPGEVILGETKILEADEWSDDKRKTLKVELDLNTKIDDLETCGIILDQAVTNTGEILEPSFGFSDLDDFLLSDIKSGPFARNKGVGFYYPNKKAKTIDISGSYCVFLPSESGDQLLVTRNVFAKPHMALKAPQLTALDLSLAVFSDNSWETDFEENRTISEELSENKGAMQSAFSDKYGEEVGNVVFQFMKDGSICCGPGSVRIIGKGENLSKIAKISFLTKDGKELPKNGVGAATSSGSNGVSSMDYGIDLKDTSTQDVTLAIHLFNDRNLVRIPFKTSVAVPTK